MVPTSGTSYNQLAVLALADQNHFQGVYYLHRALTVENPFPTARRNLELEFKKILAHKSDQGRSVPQNTDEYSLQLQSQFVKFHAKCYEGIDVDDLTKLENEILNQLGIHLKENLQHDVLTRLCLTNIAAEHVAGAKTTGMCLDLSPSALVSF